MEILLNWKANARCNNMTPEQSAKDMGTLVDDLITFDEEIEYAEDLGYQLI